MNKKDVASIKNQFKLDNDRMKIADIFNVYVMKESRDILYSESRPFSILDQDQQELFFKNFKKVLTGQMDEKLFELKFQKNAENSSQLILHKGLLAAEEVDWKEEMLLLVEKMFKDTTYEMDVVVTFIRGEYYKPTKEINDEGEESGSNTVYSHKFILCSLNQTEQSEKTLLFDFAQKEFKYNVVVDSIINLTSPVAGFLFPCFTNSYADVNHILYSAAKPNHPDIYFIEHVLNSEEILTAKENKAVFEEIVREVTGDQMNTSVLSNVYEEINRVMAEAEEETPKLDVKDVERVLKVSGVEGVNIEKVVTAFQKVVDDDKYELKASSIMPNYKTKSIKIKTKVADISISPQDLKYVKQVHFNGKKCILIEVDEDMEIEGFKLDVETL
ncbi:DUF4317 domain-containing protein [Bacillus sp. DJP31]|uniref:DUF4317 domain-containing protein n=1 Tax=Bacillus sp. DJP31 TaxID=3409789 RepID=UPI003BB75615